MAYTKNPAQRPSTPRAAPLDGEDPVLVTGHGAAAPLGRGPGPGRAQDAAAVTPTLPPGGAATPLLRPEMQRALAACRLALEDARVHAVFEPERIGLVTGLYLEDRPPRAAAGSWSSGAVARALLGDAHHRQARVLAQRLGVGGPIITLSTGEGSGEAALWQAARLLLTGRVDVALAGGVGREEGAVYLVLERQTHARQRGAIPHGAPTLSVGGASPSAVPSSGAELVVTGLGVAARAAWGVAPFLDLLRQGRLAVDDGAAPSGPRGAQATEGARAQDGMEGMALAAAREALSGADHSAENLDLHRVGLVLGLTRDLETPDRADPARASALQVGRRLVPSILGDSLRGALGLGGPCWTVFEGTGSGLLALTQAMDLLASNADLDAILVLAVDSASPRPPRPPARFRAATADDELFPTALSTGRSSQGEGASAILLQRGDQARRCGRPALARLLGHGATTSALGPTLRLPEGLDLARAVEIAVRDAGVRLSDVDVVLGLSGGGADPKLREAAAIANLFAGLPIQVSSVEGASGPPEAASGLYSAVAAILGRRYPDIFPSPGPGASPAPPPTGAVSRGGPVRRTLLLGATEEGSNVAVILGEP